MMKSILTGAALILMAAPISAQETEAPVAEAPATTSSTIAVQVKGMVCDFCARAVTKVFGKRDEVADVTVDLDTGEILLTMNAGKTLGEDTIKSLVKKSGYAFVSIERRAEG